MSEFTISPELFCGLPLVWIPCAIIARRILLRKGYDSSDSWLPGCLLGPLGVIIAFFMPHDSALAQTYLRYAGAFFALSIPSAFTALSIAAYTKSSTAGIVAFIIFEIIAVPFVPRMRSQLLKRGMLYSQAPEHQRTIHANEVWIQSADYSTQTFPFVDAADSLRLYHAHNWRDEMIWMDELQGLQQDFCPPGIGFIKDGRRFMHIMPDGVGNILVDYRSPDLPTTKRLDPVTGTSSPFVEFPESMLQAFIEAFHAGDEEWFRVNTPFSA